MANSITESLIEENRIAILKRFPSLEVHFFISFGETITVIDFSIAHSECRHLGKFTMILRVPFDENISISLIPFDGGSFDQLRLGDLRNQLGRSNLPLSDFECPKKISKWLIKLFETISKHFQSLLGKHPFPSRKNSENFMYSQASTHFVPRNFSQKYSGTINDIFSQSSPQEKTTERIIPFPPNVLISWGPDSRLLICYNANYDQVRKQKRQIFSENDLIKANLIARKSSSLYDMIGQELIQSEKSIEGSKRISSESSNDDFDLDLPPEQLGNSESFDFMEALFQKFEKKKPEPSFGENEQDSDGSGSTNSFKDLLSMASPNKKNSTDYFTIDLSRDKSQMFMKVLTEENLLSKSRASVTRQLSLGVRFEIFGFRISSTARDEVGYMEQKFFNRIEKITAKFSFKSLYQQLRTIESFKDVKNIVLSFFAKLINPVHGVWDDPEELNFIDMEVLRQKMAVLVKMKGITFKSSLFFFLFEYLVLNFLYISKIRELWVGCTVSKSVPFGLLDSFLVTSKDLSSTDLLIEKMEKKKERLDVSSSESEIEEESFFSQRNHHQRENLSRKPQTKGSLNHQQQPKESFSQQQPKGSLNHNQSKGTSNQPQKGNGSRSLERNRTIDSYSFSQNRNPYVREERKNFVKIPSFEVLAQADKNRLYGRLRLHLSYTYRMKNKTMRCLLKKMMFWLQRLQLRITKANALVSRANQLPLASRIDWYEEGLEKPLDSQSKLLKCALCLQPIRGLSICCPKCHHYGHFEHILNWFKKDNRKCPECHTCKCFSFPHHHKNEEKPKETSLK